MNIACPECSALYRVDPNRVPDGGVIARCRECDTPFRVEADMGTDAPGQHVVAPRAEVPEPAAAAAPEAAQAPESTTPESTTPEPTPQETESDEAPTGVPVFGPQDPDTRARRLARALVSDIKVYHPERWEESLQSGSLRRDFRDEILKSWEEYVEQVGEEMAKKTPYFRDALNEILAQGDRIF